MGNHRALIGLNIHTPITWTYADSSERTVASGFTTVDLYKFARQEDDNSLWMLVETTPSWMELGASDNVMLKSIYDTNDDGVVDGAEKLTDGSSGNEVTYAQAQDAVDKVHNQNTDIGTNNNSFGIGDGTDSNNKEIIADNGDLNLPKIRYNETTNTWQLSNDGITFTNIEAGVGSGDMLKATYDVDDNGIVDKAEELNDGSSGGGNAVTALEARLHIDDVDKHREINDIGSGITDLWSANKITTELLGKSNTVHTHVEADITDLDHNALKIQGAPVNAPTSADDGKVLTYNQSLDEFELKDKNPTKEIFFEPNCSGNFSDYRIRSIGSTGNFRFTFKIPHDFTSILSLVLVGIPTGDANGNYDLFSDYAGVGENYAMHSETTVGNLLVASAGDITETDISGVFTDLSAGDYCGLLWDNNGIGTALNVLGIRLQYN